MKLLTSWLMLWCAGGIAVTSLVGWITHNLSLASWVSGGTPMAISTAVMGVLIVASAILKNGNNIK